MKPMTEQQRAKLAGRRVVASVSGGKDSAALSLWLTANGVDHDRVFLDTGWEHASTYDYLRGPLTKVIGPIIEVRGPKTMEELVRAKGTFPSRVRRFCTEELKVKPMQRWIAERQDAGFEMVNAVGIRAAESEARARMPEWEWSNGFDCETWRPLIRWTEAEIIEIHHRHGLKPNPLYLMGAERVGCWPCIFARKAEIKFIADVDPARIDRIRDMERDLSERAGATRSWFQGQSADANGVYQPTPIDKAVEWSRTSRGGKQFEMFAAAGRDAGCMRWGLCETNPDGDLVQLKADAANGEDDGKESA